MEVDAIRWTAYLRAFNTSVYFIWSKLIIFLTFISFVLIGNPLVPEKVFQDLTLVYVNL